jgi:ribonuclease T2
VHQPQILALILRRFSSLVALALIALPAPLFAQALNCKVPDRFALPEVDGPRLGQQLLASPTGNLLALSWSPQFCRENASAPKNRWQCGGEAGKFGFILHGLWPDAPGRADPAWCAPAKPISRTLIRQHFCMTPSPQLLQHEWAKHGTCATSEPEKYFRAASLLYSALIFPDMNALSYRRLNVAGFVAAFTRANPGLRPNAIAVRINREGWLDSVNICLDTSYRPRPCPKEDRGAKPGRPLKIWRGK